MSDLSFQVESAAVTPFAATPTLGIRLRITTPPDSPPIQSVLLRCQIRIEPTRRPYSPPERENLSELFGAASRWRDTLRSMLWTHVSLIVPAFEGQTTVELPLPCTFDFNVAATKYFEGLQDGEIPLTLLFSGTVFYAGEHGLQVAPISWEKEAAYRLPLALWREMMDQYYPNVVWLCLRRDIFDRLHEFKRRAGLPTWEQTLEALLANAADRLSPPAEVVAS